MNPTNPLDSSREEPIPLIIYNPDTSKYIINDEAIDYLKSIPGPIGIVAVAGLYRTGKSYLLNRMLLNRSNGFGVGPTINPCTKGLWIWNRPIPGRMSDGTPINVLIIDSEGIGALNEDSSHDTKIFSLAILLSSCFIYNSVGSIDENAIQNLSLVVNLTKNIHIRSQNQGDSEEFEDFGHYFPSFVWVVRDFTLQLVDPEGENIDSKEYLEKALNQQKGFSESVESKNRIRRLLTTFFKERDCWTLVRPLTKEENLQNLDKLELTKLRPEFYDQVNKMREKILNNVRPKLIQRSFIDGQMYVGLMQSYIESINNGGVPNIENAWVSVCRERCGRSLQDSYEFYEKSVKETLIPQLPLSLERLSTLHRGFKGDALKIFENRAMGEGLAREFYEELLVKMKKRYAALKIENLKESQRKSLAFLIQEYKRIETRLNSQEYSSFADYERDLTALQEVFMKKGPGAVDCEKVLAEFVRKAASDAMPLFFKTLRSELELQKTLGSAIQKKLEEQIAETEAESQRSREGLAERLAEMERALAEKTDGESRWKREKEDIQAKLEAREAELAQVNKKYQEENDKARYESRINTIGYDEMLRNVEREHLMKLGEFEKEKALLSQRVLFLERSNEELAKKDKDSANELRTARKEFNTQLKEATNKYEQIIKANTNRTNELQERLIELENEVAEAQQNTENEQKKRVLAESKSLQTIEEFKEKWWLCQQELSKLKEERENGLDRSKSDYEKLAQGLNEKITDMQRTIVQRDDRLKALKSESEKEKAILMQKLEFQNLQLKETEQQLVENKKAHEAILKALEFNTNDDSRTDSKQLEHLKEAHKREIKTLESEFENQKKRLLSQIDQLGEKSHEQELKAKLELSDIRNELQSMKEELEQSEVSRGKLLEQIKAADSNKVKQMKEAEERSIQKIRLLEREIEDLKQNSQSESLDLQKRSEDSLRQLKLFYESERERLEKRIVEEKERYDRRIAQAVEEYESKLKEEQGTYEEELENLREEVKGLNEEREKLDKKYSHDIALKQQSIESLEKYVRETKESLLTNQEASSKTLEQHLGSFNAERKALVEKNETLMNEIARKEKEIAAVVQAKEVLENNLGRKEAQMDAIRKETSEERKIFEKKLEELRIMCQKVSDELLEKKIEFGREMALSSQQNEFLMKRIEEFQRQNDTFLAHYEEKLKTQKTELLQDFQEKQEKILEEKGQLEAKYEKARKSLKEIEGTYNRQLAQLEKEKTIAQEKLGSFEAKRQEGEARYLQDINGLAMQNAQMKETFSAEKRVFITEIEKFKGLYIQAEQEKNETITNYERDKVLWEGKFAFLEGQKEQAKQDLVDALKKFELTLHHLKKARNNEKDEQETNLNELLVTMERKYQSQIQDINEGHQRVIQDYEERIRKLERELRNLNEKLIKETQGKLGHQLFNESKLAELQENERHFRQEIDSLKQEREAKIVDFQRLLENERELFKGKLNEFELKYKESESRRNALIFEHEKEKAKWGLEKEHLIGQRNELQDFLEKLENRKETLLRENAKLRSDSRISKKSINLNALSSSNVGPNLNNFNNTSSCNQNNNSNNSFLMNQTQQNKYQNSMTYNQIQLNSSSINNNNNNNKKKNLTDITNFSGIMAYDPNKMMFVNHANISLNSDDEGSLTDKYHNYK